MPGIDKALVFDVWGDYSHFRRGYTTTSPLTYPFPTRTTLSGMIAAIRGLPRDNYYNLFSKDNSAIALQIINPIKKVRITQNLIDTSTGFYLWDNNGQRTPTSFEYLKESKYRIYLWMKENLDNFGLLLKEHKSIYTPYLGISECIMNFEYIGIFDIELHYTEGEIVEISSIILNSNEIKIVLEEGKKYGKIKIPGFMGNNRIVQDFLEMIYEESGEKIKITSGNYYRVIGKNIDVNIIFF